MRASEKHRHDAPALWSVGECPPLARRLCGESSHLEVHTSQTFGRSVDIIRAMHVLTLLGGLCMMISFAFALCALVIGRVLRDADCVGGHEAEAANGEVRHCRDAGDGRLTVMRQRRRADRPS